MHNIMPERTAFARMCIGDGTEQASGGLCTVLRAGSVVVVHVIGKDVRMPVARAR